MDLDDARLATPRCVVFSKMKERDARQPGLPIGGLDLRPGGASATPDQGKAVLPLPGGALHRDPRRRGAAPHAADAFGTGRVRRHGADGVQDEEGDRLPPEPAERLHLRDGRHAALPGEPGGHRRGHRAVPDHEHGHHRRGPHRPEAVPRRLASPRASSARPSSA